MVSQAGGLSRVGVSDLDGDGGREISGDVVRGKEIDPGSSQSGVPRIRAKQRAVCGTYAFVTAASDGDILEQLRYGRKTKVDLHFLFLVRRRMGDFWYFSSFLLLFWTIVHLINVLRPRSSHRRPSPTSFSLAYFSFHVSTSIFNPLPAYFLSVFNRSRSNLKAKNGYDSPDSRRATHRFVEIFYDVGTIVAVLGLVVAQAVLAWATVSSIGGVYELAKESRTIFEAKNVVAPHGLIKRTFDTPSSRSARSDVASNLLLRPVVSPSLQNCESGF